MLLARPSPKGLSITETLGEGETLVRMPAKQPKGFST